jgi:hypothetical protein
MKIVIALAVALLSVVSAAQAGSLKFELNPNFNQSLPLVPGEVNQRLVSYRVTAPITEGIILTSLPWLDVVWTGILSLENLQLYTGSTRLSLILEPADSNLFQFNSLYMAAGWIQTFDLYGDITSFSRGTLRIDAEGFLLATGQTSGMVYADSGFGNIEGGTHQIGTTPEPGTWLMIVGGLGLMALRRRK